MLDVPGGGGGGGGLRKQCLWLLKVEHLLLFSKIIPFFKNLVNAFAFITKILPCLLCELYYFVPALPRPLVGCEDPLGRALPNSNAPSRNIFLDKGYQAAEVT